MHTIRTETAHASQPSRNIDTKKSKYMMMYFIASVIKCCPGEERRSMKAYDRGTVSQEGQRRFLEDVGGGGRVSGLLRRSTCQDLGTDYMPEGKTTFPQRSVVETTLTHSQSTRGRRQDDSGGQLAARAWDTGARSGLKRQIRRTA